MVQADFIFLHVPNLLQVKESPPGRFHRVALTYSEALVGFLLVNDLLVTAAEPDLSCVKDLILRTSDLTIEGRLLIKAGAISKWLGACDRKSRRILESGRDEEQAIAVYSDTAVLNRYLDKIRSV